MEAYATAHDALFTQAELAPGERLLVNGAAGGVGTAAVQLGLAVGADVTGTARSNVERVRELGASTEPEGEYDVILELVGGSALAEDVRRLAPRGRLAVIGTGAGRSAEIDFGPLMGKRGRIHGSTLRSRSRRRQGPRRRPAARTGAPALRVGTHPRAGARDVPAGAGRGGLRGVRRARQVREARPAAMSDTRAAILADAYGFMVTQSIGTVARAGIADLVADGHETIPELAAESGLPLDSLRRILRALAALEIFSLDGDRVQQHAEVGAPAGRGSRLGQLDRAELRERALSGLGARGPGVPDRCGRDARRARERLLRVAR